MAVVHVSNWNDFKAAITGEANTVILDNDIDANGDIINDRINVCALEIDGQGHTIYNYTSTHTGSDFWLDFYYNNQYITCAVKNINFYNIIIAGETGSEAMFRANNGKFIITNCKMQGISNKALMRNCQMRQCSCNFSKLKYIGGYSSDNSIEECWFNVGSVTLSSDEIYYRGNIAYSYFTGIIDTKSLFNREIFNSRCTSSIFNFELTDSSNETKNIYLCSGGASNICLYNVDKLSFPANVTFSVQNNFTGLSDASLKSSEAVNATGFTPFAM